MNQRREEPLTFQYDDKPLTEKDLASRARARRNWDWFDAHASEIYAQYRGKCLCVAGQELFAADTPAEAIAMARAAHPDDDGLVTRIIPLKRSARIRCVSTAVGSNATMGPFAR